MAHPCFECGGECYCHGDWDDIIVCNTPNNCEGCGCYEMFEEYCNEWHCDSWDDDYGDYDTWDDVQRALFDVCPNCNYHYDEVDYEYQICHLCGWNAYEDGKPVKKNKKRPRKKGTYKNRKIRKRRKMYWKQYPDYLPF